MLFDSPTFYNSYSNTFCCANFCTLMKIISKSGFDVPEAAQKLYVRLFSRRLAWLPLSKISYPEISDDIGSLLGALVDARLIISGLYVQHASFVGEY